MATETIVTIEDIPVMYVAGEEGKPFAEQAPGAFEKLEASLSSFKGRKFYGAVIGDEYRACVNIEPDADVSALPHPTWTIPAGRYARRQMQHWEDNIPLIGQTFEDLCQRSDFDPSRPCIEYYRSQKDLLIMVPVQ